MQKSTSGLKSTSVFLTVYRKGLAGALLFTLMGAFSAFAETYDWVEMGKSDLRVITNPKIEAEFRLDLIGSAESSIDLVTFDQRMDNEVGLPLLKKLAEAAARGLRIRYAISASMTPVTDPLNHVGHYLSRVASQYPNLEYLFPGGTSMMWTSGWGVLDGIHEKLLIIDGKLGFVTGRGHAGLYSNWLDTAYAFKGPLVDQSKSAFDRLWKTLHRELNIPEAPSSQRILELQSAHEASSSESTPLILQTTAAEESEFASLVEWRKSPPSQQKDYRARLLHHDFLDQMRATGRKPSSVSLQERTEIIIDPIVEEVKSLISQARSMHYCSLATIMNPHLKESMLQAMKQPENPLQLEVFTNSKIAHTLLSTLHLPAGWYAGLKDLDDLLQTHQAKAFQLEDHGVDPSCLPLIWLHRKLILIGNGEKSTVIFGSHNLTYASSVALDEMSFEIESAEFYQEMLDIYNNSLNTYGTELQPDAIHQQHLSEGWQEWLASYFQLMF